MHIFETDIAKVTETGGTLLDRITLDIFPSSWINFFNVRIFEFGPVILNLWSLLHFFIGMLFYKFISKEVKNLIYFKLAFEITEYLLGQPGHPPLQIEIIDSGLDILWSYLGFKLAERRFS